MNVRVFASSGDVVPVFRNGTQRRRKRPRLLTVARETCDSAGTEWQWRGFATDRRKHENSLNHAVRVVAGAKGSSPSIPASTDEAVGISSLTCWMCYLSRSSGSGGRGDPERSGGDSIHNLRMVFCRFDSGAEDCEGECVRVCGDENRMKIG